MLMRILLTSRTASRISGLLLIGCAATLGSQTITIGTPVVVAVGTVQHALSEPYVAVDPSNSDHLVAVSMVDRPPGLKDSQGMDQQLCAAFVSFDGGATWARYDFDVTGCFDPWVGITPDGNTLVTMVGAHATLKQQRSSGLVAFHSSDGGRTWDSLPAGLGRSHDHPTTAVDLSAGPHRGWIYVSSHRPRVAEDGRVRYGIYVARSRTGGRTFDDPAYIIVNNLHNLTEMPVVLSDGTLIESFVDASHFTDTTGAARSEKLFDRRRAWVMRSSDGGASFSTPLFVTDDCGPPPGYRLSAFTADLSTSEFGGTLYFACKKAGGGPIVVTHSHDRGESWTSTVTVPPAGSDPTVRTSVLSIGVNARGTVLVAWYDGSPSGESCKHNLYVSVSTDGGDSFSPGTRVSCGDGGDYFGLAALADGRFRLLWPEMRDGTPQLRTAIVTVE